MPGAGIDAAKVGLMRIQLPLTEVHASCTEPLQPASPGVLALGFDSGGRRQTESEKVAAVKVALLN